MKNKGYIICRNKNEYNITLTNYSKDGFNFKPLNKIKYPGIKVNSLVIVNKDFIEKILKRKIKKRLNSFVKLMISVVEDEDDDPNDVTKALNELSKYRSIIINKYRKYLDEKYVTLLLKKLDFLENELKQKMIYMDDLIYEELNETRKTR